MTIITTPRDMQALSRKLRSEGARMGFVPTMGFLHDGHLSLVRHARREGGATHVIMSIFVNPTQFGPGEDFEKYPRNFENDRAMAEREGVDVLFYPATHNVYPPGARTFVEVEDFGKVLCGMTRPTHFRGVTTVVSKLFHMVQPHLAVFGQKDAQQYIIIRRMVQDLAMDVEILRAPIVREPDGLAMSSRNVYLGPEERRDAVCLSESLGMARRAIDAGERRADVLRSLMKTHIDQRPSARLDYIGIVDTENLSPRSVLKGETLIAIAAFFGTTRLIDNIIMDIPENA